MKDCLQGYIQELLTQVAHGRREVSYRDIQRIVMAKSRQLARQLARDRRCREVEALQHEEHDVAAGFQCRLDLAPQPVSAIATALERRGREQDEEMCPGADVFEDDALEVAAGDALKIEEHVIPVLGQVLEDCQCPGEVGAPVTDKHGFLNAAHVA